MGNSKHKMKKKKRHERQIENGEREKQERIEKKKVDYTGRVPVRLSAMNPVIVRKVLELVAAIDMTRR